MISNQQKRSPVPPRPDGIEIGWLCGWIVKGLIVLVILAIVGGISAAIISDNGDTEEPTRVATPRPTARPLQRIAVTATSRPAQRITATATSRPRPTATAINESSHQRWLEGQEHRKNVNTFYSKWEQISADGVVDFNEYLQVCSLIPQWTNQLTAARDFVEEYRKVEPKTFRENQGMFEAIKSEAERGLQALAIAECE